MSSQLADVDTRPAVPEGRASAEPATRPAGFGRILRFELTKLLAQWRTRVLLLLVCVAPGAFIAVVGSQSSLPADTVFGRQMATTGWAGVLVVLSFCGTWALPLLVSLVAADMFAAEDRLGTWRHLIVAARSVRRIFAAKALACLLIIALMLVGIVASALLGGLLAVGNHPLLGLDGHTLTPSQAAGATMSAWLSIVLPTLAFSAIGLLSSVTLGPSPVGLLLPALLSMALQVLQFLPLPVGVRLALPSYGFLGWRGLFTDPPQLAPLFIGMAVTAAWLVITTALAYRLFVRRDFTDVTNAASGRRLALGGLIPLAAVTALSVALVSLTSPATGSGITRAKVDASLATSFGHLYRLQLRELHRPDATESQLGVSASCDKGGSTVADDGPGNDWRCTVGWHVPGSSAVGTAIFQLDVTPDGKYVADGDGPKDVNGFYLVHTAAGDVPNPLWQFDGLVDLHAK